MSAFLQFEAPLCLVSPVPPNANSSMNECEDSSARASYRRKCGDVECSRGSTRTVGRAWRERGRTKTPLADLRASRDVLYRTFARAPRPGCERDAKRGVHGDKDIASMLLGKKKVSLLIKVWQSCDEQPMDGFSVETAG